MEIEFDIMLKNPADLNLSRRVVGTYRISRNKVKYSTEKPSRLGLTQYLEMTPIKFDVSEEVEKPPKMV